MSKKAKKVPQNFENPQVFFKPQEKKTWKQFIYDKQSKQILGRTASGWGKFLVFFLIFYSEDYHLFQEK